MKEKAFLKYLSNNNVSQEEVAIYISRLNEFNEFLEKDNKNIDSIPDGEIVNYTEYLIENNKLVNDSHKFKQILKDELKIDVPSMRMRYDHCIVTSHVVKLLTELEENVSFD